MNREEASREICEIGRRIYARGFAAGNDGNLTYRLGPQEILCTPTLICKGFMTPDDLCTCDLSGNQLSGNRKLTSEILLHLAILRARLDVASVVHCHPPHATAFAVTHQAIPARVLAEVELFLGPVPIAPYATPSTQAVADNVLPFVQQSNTIVLANHGTVSFAQSIERAFWWTEILDAYCRILLLARGLGPLQHFTDEQQRDLVQLKAKWNVQ